MSTLTVAFKMDDLMQWSPLAIATFFRFHSVNSAEFLDLPYHEQEEMTRDQLGWLPNWHENAGPHPVHVQLVLNDGRVSPAETFFQFGMVDVPDAHTIEQIHDWYNLAQDKLHPMDWDRAVKIWENFNLSHYWLHSYRFVDQPTVNAPYVFNPVPPKKLGRRNLKPVPLP